MGDSPVGFIGDDAVADQLRNAGISVVSGSLSNIPATDHVIAVGHAAIRAVAVSEDDPLVVPVAAGRGIRSVARDDIGQLLDTLSEPQIERHPVLTITVAGESVGTALWDVTVVTTEAARISEYAISTSADTIGQFRADGVVIATPAGSTGYASRIGGPVLGPMPDIGAVVPIAPFQTNPDHWVLPFDGLSVTIKRDEATVAVYADGDRASVVERGESVTLSRTDTIRIAVSDDSQSRFR
jgi:NAD+ kinase